MILIFGISFKLAFLLIRIAQTRILYKQDSIVNTTTVTSAHIHINTHTHISCHLQDLQVSCILIHSPLPLSVLLINCSHCSQAVSSPATQDEFLLDLALPNSVVERPLRGLYSALIMSALWMGELGLRVFHCCWLTLLLTSSSSLPSSRTSHSSSTFTHHRCSRVRQDTAPYCFVHK